MKCSFNYNIDILRSEQTRHAVSFQDQEDIRMLVNEMCACVWCTM